MKIGVIGGGAAGFFSAIHNKQKNPNSTVIILEKSADVLAKVKVSGGGRCNVTHACFDPRVLCEHYPRGARELRGPLTAFGPKDTMDWFEGRGVPLKIEADHRVFPQSNLSQDIIDCLIETATGLGIQIWTKCQVTGVSQEEDAFILSLADREPLVVQKLVLATGSSRAGYAIATDLGHTIVDPIPSLFTFKINDSNLHALSGLSVADTRVWLSGEKKQWQQGPLLITHWGMSGPGIIKLSAWRARELHKAKYCVSLVVNWLPNFDTGALGEFQTENLKKNVMTQSPFSAIPLRLWKYLVEKAGLSGTVSWNQLTHKQLDALKQELTHSVYSVTGKGTFKEEFVTCGGVALAEINFKTMESKCCFGLHIVGELLDIDGVTGGFNFQNAWTTGFISGSSL